jgi:hypothetical protein
VVDEGVQNVNLCQQFLNFVKVDEAVRTGIVHGDLFHTDVVHTHWQFIPSLMQGTNMSSVLM